MAENPNPPAGPADGFGQDRPVGVLVPSANPMAPKVVAGSMPAVRPELAADLDRTCGFPGSSSPRPDGSKSSA